MPEPTRAFLVSSEVVFGARTVPSEDVDAAFRMPSGKLRTRAGILSLVYAVAEETEVSLGARAAELALRTAAVPAREIDLILASTETYLEVPSLAAHLHRAIGAQERCGAMDIGGACLGFVHALAVAKTFLEAGEAGQVLVVTADVHSRTLLPGRVAGEFGGLFGDGASAFLLRRPGPDQAATGYAVCDFFFGCASQYQQAIQVRAEPNDRLRVV